MARDYRWAKPDSRRTPAPVEHSTTSSPELVDQLNPSTSTIHPGLSPERILQLQRKVGNSAVSRMLQRRVGGAELDLPASEATSIDVTGRYEALESGSSNRIMLQINQAGRHIQGWWQRHIGRGEGNAQTLSRYRHRGDLASDADGSVRFSYERSAQEGVVTESYPGTLSARRDGETLLLTLTEGTWSHTFARYSAAPRLSDQAIENMPAESRELIRASETNPLDMAEEALIEITAGDIRDDLLRYFATSRANIGREVRAMNMSRQIGTRMKTFAAAQRPLALRLLRQYLTNNELTNNGTRRPLWDWLQVIVAAHPNATGAIQTHLDIQPSGALGPDTPQHKYRWMFSTVGLSGDVGVGLGGFLGVFVIEKLEPTSWRTRYFTVMGQASGGASVGVQVGQTTAWSEFETPFPWTSGNFRGSFTITGGSAGGSFAGGGGGGTGFIIFDGDGTYPSVAGDATGLMAIYGAYLGAEVSGTGGYLWGGRDEAVREAARQSELTAESTHETSESVHFDVNDPSLRPEGRAAIREMCALHRAALSSPTSALSVNGYASTTGTERRNEVLAIMRAENTVQAIRDILGDALTIPDDQISVEGHGARAARAAGSPEGEENRDWRRVDVRINGHVVLTLQ